MPTLTYKLVEFGLRLAGGHKLIPKAVARGGAGSADVPKKLQKRFEKTTFQDRDVWTVHPKEGVGERAYVHQHGGAFVLGLAGLHFEFAALLADRARVSVILPDYPIPPHVRARQTIDFAAAHFDQCVADWGVQNVVLGGDSAGGNLALAIAQTRRTHGHEQPAHLLLLSPWVDLVMGNPALNGWTYDKLLEPQSLRAAAELYAGEMMVDDPLISPINAALDRLAPMSIFSGAHDLLHKDILRFAEKAKQAGVRKKLAVYGDYGHIWFLYPTADREDALLQITEILRGN